MLEIIFFQRTGIADLKKAGKSLYGSIQTRSSYASYLLKVDMKKKTSLLVKAHSFGEVSMEPFSAQNEKLHSHIQKVGLQNIYIYLTYLTYHY